MNGWIKIHRTMLQWEHFNEPSVVTVFLALLLNADRDGKTGISLSGLTSATGLTTNTVRCALAKLVNSGEITRDFVKGQKTTTSIANWSKYQVYQKMTHQDKEGVSKNDTPPCQKLIDHVSKIDTPTHYNNNKNVEESKQEKQKEYAHAQGFGEIWDEWFGEFTNQTIESLCMHERVTIEELKDAAELAIIDMTMNGDTNKLGKADKQKSLYGLMIFKLKKNNNNGQRITQNGNGKANTVTGFKILNKS